MRSPLWSLMRQFSWQELRHHPWRNAAAVVSVMLGVALAFSVHLINASALQEFAQAARAAGGEADLEMRGNGNGLLDDRALGLLARHPDVASVSPVLELTAVVLPRTEPNPNTPPAAAPAKVTLRVVGIDALQAARLTPSLLPLPSAGADRLAVLAPATGFLNAAARQQLQITQGMQEPTLQLQVGLGLQKIHIAGSVAAGGAPLMVMDIGAAQDLFAQSGQLSRIDIRLRGGVDRGAFSQALQASADWPPGARLAEPGEAVDRLGAMSRAYRVNLTVLALVALFTGGFLVFSVLTLSVSRRAPQLALLGVLGLTGTERLQLVLAEATVMGALGSALGLALGGGLAALALHWLGGDLGGGYFSGAAATLQWSPVAAAVFASLGVLTALLGAWQPARAAQGLVAAQTLKGLGAPVHQDAHAGAGTALLLAGFALALLPPVGGVPIAAYASVAAILLGGITALPWLVGLLLARLAPYVAYRPLPLLAVERARRVRASAAVAVSGVVASLSLAVALTVMVASFRDSVTHWLDQVLPATLYVRAAAGTATQNAAFLDAAFVQEARSVAGVARVSTQRSQSVLLDPALPAITLLARTVDDLPLRAPALPVPPGHIGVYVSEPMVDLYGAQPGTLLPGISKAFRPLALENNAWPATFFIAGVWRDYGRQFGSVAIAQEDFVRLSGDARVNDLALWLAEGADLAATQQALRDMADRLAPAGHNGAGRLLEFATSQEIRAISLRIFDRSFAVTVWLQAVAIGIGLFGVAASFSAQVLARRKEFGLLLHLGLTRTQVLQVVALEGAAWTALGALGGVLLGLAVGVVLVHVVNPQSFHWTMELSVPLARIGVLAAAVVVAGTLTAWVCARAAAGRDAVLAVKEDW